MIGKSLLILFILIELSFIILSLIKKTNFKREKAVTRISLFMLFILFVLIRLIPFEFQWYSIGLYLLIHFILGLIVLTKKKADMPVKNVKIVLFGINRMILILFIFTPILVFPQYKPIKPTGAYQIGTVSYTITDSSREEYFTEGTDYRSVTIQFWFPANESGDILDSESKYPLVLFSHGAFGYRMSNYSTYAELASNGYIVCSIDHTYHAFMTSQIDGQKIIADMEFMNNVIGAQNGEISGEELYKLETEWMDLRTKDMKFVLNYIQEKSSEPTASGVYANLDLDHIGVTGHSLGGATAAKIGRDEASVDAVIVIDGTMMGEIIGLNEGKEIITNEPYQKPLLNIYNESHYREANETENYPNMLAYKSAKDGYQVVINGSGHMSFTDLPIISPFLSNMLETSEIADVDPKYCIETTNKIVLEFFNKYLKGSNEEINRERTY